MALFSRRSLPVLAVIAVMLVTFLPLSPITRPLPGRDAGIYLYSGDQILHGALPYRDVWDNRPPGLFYLSATGLALGGGSVWGVWVLEAAFLCGAAVFSFLALRRVLSDSAAFLATFVWTMTLVFLYDFNIAEEYALLFQFAALYCFVRAEQRNHYGGYGIAIGACLALAVNLRQNLIGLWVAIMLFLLIRALLNRGLLTAVRAGTAIAVGIALVFVPLIIYFAANGILKAMWDGAYLFNFVYVTAAWDRRFDAFGLGANLLAQSGLLPAALAGWFIGAYSLWARRDWPARPLIAVAMIALPFDLLLSSLSGRPYPHYFISALPALAVLAAVCFDQLMALARSATQRAASPAVWVAGLMLAALILPAHAYLTLDNKVFAANSSRARLIAFIHDNTRPTDTVYLWGADMMINLGAGRTSPTRLTNNYPLFMPGYQSQALIDGFVDELRRNPPAYIIDTAYTNKLIPPINADDRQRWAYNKANNINPRPEADDFNLIPAMDRFFNYVAQNYHPATHLSVWIIYQRNDFKPLAGGVLQ